ncbi:MAG: hypothetical protein JWQ16_122 [Novosphingobium sp.]|nr:hypothetical protein [Novosphingobium sp.]
MSALRLAADRANRNAAHRVFNTRLERIKADVAARGIGSRVAGTMVEEVSGAVDMGLDVARERKGLIAGTIGALLLWVFRQPLIAGAASLFEHFAGQSDIDLEDEDDSDDEGH